jgi:hypothetical protein
MPSPGISMIVAFMVAPGHIDNGWRKSDTWGQ